MAVALALLVLEVKLPNAAGATDAELWAAIAGVVDGVAAWAASFFVLVFRVSHRALFAMLARVDRGVFWLAVRSRDLVVRVTDEPGRLIRPGLADGLVGREAT